MYPFAMSDKPTIDINKSLESLRKLPAKKRLDAIYEDPRQMELLSAMSPHDLLITIEEIGPENTLELFELLAPQKVQEILDMAIWTNDRIDPLSAGRWLSLLFESNPERATEQLDGLDVELIGLMFKMVAEIYDTSLNEEYPDHCDLVSKSPDGRFIICFSDQHEAKGLARAMHHYLEQLYGLDMRRALSLLEKIRFELASGLEEASFRWRDGRLADMGILPRDERLAYFATLNVGELKREPEKPVAPSLEELPTSPLLTHVHRLGEKYPFLEAALAKCSIEQAHVYFESLVHASLNMHASLSGNFGDVKEMTHTVEYVKTLAEFGLAQAAEGNLAKAGEILFANDIRSMIRLGRTALVNLRKIVRSALHDQSMLLGADFIYADSPLREVARALMLPEPRYYEGLLDANKLTLRFFSSLIELKACLNAMNELRFRAKLIGPEVLGCTIDALKDYQGISHANIYARYLVNTFLGNSNLLGIINSADQRRLRGEGHTLSDDFVSFAKNYANALADKLSEHSYFDSTQALEMTNNFSTAVLIQLEQNPELLLG